MKQLILALFIILLYLPHLSAQTYSYQNLNKTEDAASFVTSNLQDYDGDGDLDIIVGQRDPSGLYWLENEPTQQFPKHPIVTENIRNIKDVDIADFDNDGDMDYVVCMAHSTSDGELVWFQRQEDGTYIKWTISINKDFRVADVADFNGDGWIDIAAIGRVYFNQGTLFFEEEVVATGDISESIDAEDLDGDGDMDIAIGGSGLTVNNEGSRTLINDGNGSFSLGTFIHCRGDSYTDCGHQVIKIVDLNGDGSKDILGFTILGTGGLYWLDGSDDFEQYKIDKDGGVDLGGNLVVFDIDGNGLLDVVRQNDGDNRVSILYQTTNMEFEREYIELGWENRGSANMSAGDLDGDGDLDLVFPEKGNVDDDISWFENINGKLHRHYIFSQLGNVRISKFVDIDQDGDLDIAATISEEDEVMLFENRDGENFVNWRVHDNINYAADIEPTDVDGDGDIDLVVTATDANDLVWLENTGTLYDWEYHKIEDNANFPLGCAVADIDKDGDVDIALCSQNDDKVFWYQNDGAGNFSKRVVAPLLDGPREIELADFNGDGNMDAAIACNETGSTVAVYLNNGSGSFSQEIIFTGKVARDIELGDWDEDGNVDIVVSLYASNGNTPRQDIVLFSNDGQANFTTVPLVEGRERTNGLRLGDVDLDGDLDIVYGYNDDFRLMLGINEGNSELNIIPLSSVSNGHIHGIVIGDFNADGIPDIVYADFGRDNLILLTGSICPAPEVEIEQVGYSHFALRWDEPEESEGFFVRAKNAGTSTWDIELDWTGGDLVYANINPCWEYVFEIASYCDGNLGLFQTTNITTEGCDDEYCYSYGLAFSNWIESVDFNGQMNDSGNQYGYWNFTEDLTFNADIGQEISLQLEPGTFDDPQTTVYWSVWIDYDQNNSFSSNEKVLSLQSDNETILTPSFVIDENADIGQTRMRIMMGLEENFLACETSNSNLDVEDYRLEISSCPAAVFSQADATCGQNNGTIFLDDSNYVNPVFDWEHGASGNLLTNLAPNTYTVLILDDNDCKTTLDFTIGATPLSEIEVVTTPATCDNGGTASVNLLNGAALFNYNWSNGESGAIVEDWLVGTYTVTVLDVNACEIAESFEIIGAEIPTVDLGEDVTINEGETVQLEASSSGEGLTYLWSTGETSAGIEVNEMGTYSVIVTNSDGCMAMDELVVTVITNIEDLTYDLQLSISPNPMNDQLFVSFLASKYRIKNLQIIDMLGRVMATKSINIQENHSILNLSMLPSGTYFLVVNTDSGQVVEKILKQ